MLPMTTTRIRTAIAGLVAGAIVASAGLPAAPADASVGSMSASLSVSRNYQRYSVDVKGYVKMTQTEAQNMVNQGYRVTWKLWGSDPISDDFLFGPDPASISASSRGLEFSGFRITTGGMLDEDDSWTDEHDELYAGVRLIKPYPSTTTVRSAESNEVGGYF
jgi:hypothetical protein